MEKFETNVKNILRSEDTFECLLTTEEIAILDKTKSIIAGGTLASILTGREINDIDIFVSSDENLLEILEVFNSARNLLHSSNKAITFSPRNINQVPIQIIFDRYYNSGEEIFKSFDFTVCMASYKFGDDAFEYHEDFFMDNAARILTFNEGTLYPIISMLRTEKYQKYGYTISQLEKIKILAKIASLNIQTPEELRHHIGGLYGNDIAVDENTPEGFKERTLGVVEDEIHDIYNKIAERRFGKFVGKVLIKSVEKLSEGVYRSNQSYSSKLGYQDGQEITYNPGQNKWFYAHSSISHTGYMSGEPILIWGPELEQKDSLSYTGKAYVVGNLNRPDSLWRELSILGKYQRVCEMLENFKPYKQEQLIQNDYYQVI